MEGMACSIHSQFSRRERSQALSQCAWVVWKEDTTLQTVGALNPVCAAISPG